MADLLDLTVAEAAAKIAAGEISADEYGSAWRAAAATDDLNAYLWTAEGADALEPDWNGDGESAPAGEGDATPYGANAPAPADSGPLAGVPIAIKDIFTTQGIPTTAGSRILEGYRPPYTATAVRKLTAAGARVLGKTNMDEFAMGSSNENSGYGPVLNPWDRGRVPGGSSGGSAAAVAGGLAPAALGTDTGGSIRQPASLCGIVGLKPTYGAISRFGMIAFASSLDQCGPFTRDVTDSALLLGAMQGKDPLDSTSVGIEGGIELPSREDLSGLKFGVPKELGESAIDPGVRAVFEVTVGKIEELGGQIVEVTLPHAEHGISAYYVIAPAEASSNLARFDGVRYGLREAGDEDLIEMYERTRSEGFGAEVKRRIMLGTYALSSGYYDAYYGQAQKVRTRIAGDFDTAFAEVDFVITPTSPSVAFELGAKTDDPLAMYMNDFFTVPMSLAGIPAIAIPAGLAAPEGAADGAAQLPVGFQIAAPAFGEQALLEAAHALEGALGFAAAAGDAVPYKGVPVPDTPLEAVIGLEIHVQLSTRTKMFCGCEVSFGDEPNTHTCPICLAHPGVLPVPNEEAIRYALKIGMALGCEIAPRSIFHRKNYFYPDNPKAYQISQYDIPICGEGKLGDIRITRAHLEEDAAKSIHVGESGRIASSTASLVDFNRGGTPLVEIVTEPDLRGGAEAAEWARLLRETVRQLDVSDVNMEEGSLRIDANVSVRPEGSTELGVKTELKNMNSFRFVQRGIEAELERQRELIGAGGKVEQETLHFDPASGHLTSLRSKEEAHDYRYFPEPDLVAIAPTEAMLAEARDSLPELPAARTARLESELGLDEAQARLLAGDPEGAEYFEAVVAAVGEGAEPRVVANWVTGDLTAALRASEDAERPEASDLADLVRAVAAKTVSHAGGKGVLAILVADRDADVAEIIEREGLAQMGGDDGELAGIVAAAIEGDPAAAEQIRSGNGKAIGAIVGVVMRETKGRADGGEVNRLIREQLGL